MGFHYRHNGGAGLTEYVVVVALIAIGTLGVIMLVDDNNRAIYSSAANSLAGAVSNITRLAVTQVLHEDFGLDIIPQAEQEDR